MTQLQQEAEAPDPNVEAIGSPYKGRLDDDSNLQPHTKKPRKGKTEASALTTRPEHTMFQLLGSG